MNHQVCLLFEPLDVLLLRDHRPFEIGQHVLARSSFPQPSVFRGALRSALFRNAGADFAASDEHFGITRSWARTILGGRSRPGTLALRGPLLARRRAEGIEPLFHAPLDLLCDEEQRVWTILAPQELNTIEASRPRRWHLGPGSALEEHGTALPWTEAEFAKNDGQLLLTAAAASAYLEGDLKRLRSMVFDDQPQWYRRDRLISTESRFGIARDPDTRTVDEGKFYLTRCYRLDHDHGFAVELDLTESGGEWRNELESAIQALDGEIVPLGGKAHRASIRVIDGRLFDLEVAVAGDSGRGTKLWLQTAAPNPLPPDCGRQVSQVTSRASLVGGFDLARRQPRPLRRALPAGTVLYLKDIEPQAAREKLAAAQSNDDRLAGYGVALAGRW